jgi:acyl-CoA dehydrogenase
MEVIAKYGSEAQKRRWLDPLLEGKIRSAFLMTEPQVASSDASNIEMSIKRDGDSYVLNGQVCPLIPYLPLHYKTPRLTNPQKWWSSGIGDPRCEIYIVLGKTDPNNADKYKQQSVILVPHNTPGITIHRMLSVFGYDDAPHGHGHVTFENVRVPASNMVLGEGKGFEIIQGRLGPGRIHHAMRSIGAAEKALEWFLARINDPAKKPFGEQLHKHGIMLERVARSRIEIDAARLAVLNAAIKIDESNAKGALKEIAEVKVLVPQVNLDVIDRAIQAYGGAGVSQETPLASMYALGRTMRIVDGPDEVHLLQLGKNENKRGPAHKARIEAQTKKGQELCRKYGIEARDPLYLNRKSGEASKL